jgi:DNA-nicking Smr family endonuclease
MDQQLWCQCTQDVQPLKKTGVMPVSMTKSITHAKLHPHVNHTLDLHGMTLSQAYQAVQHHVQQGVHAYTYVTIITGKSGIMHEQLPDWLNHMTQIRSCDPINGGGAYKISFKKTRHTQK